MRVIGLSPLDRDATVSFVEDGEIAFACAEERLSRVKLQDGFPERALRAGFAATGWSPDDVDAVAYPFFDHQREAQLMHAGVAADRRLNRRLSTARSLRLAAGAVRSGRRHQVEIPGLAARGGEFVPRKSPVRRTVLAASARSALLDRAAHQRFYRRWLRGSAAEHQQRSRELSSGLAAFGLDRKLRRFDHHDTHAANAFWASGFDQALVVALDGYGSGNCGAVYRASGDGIECLHRFAFPNSLGQFYESVTSALGFQPGRHEGKIVGLAAYGDPDLLRVALRARFSVVEGDIGIAASMNYLFARALAQRFAMRDVAAAYQAVLEEVAREAIGYWQRRTGLTRVALSGGVAANVKLNQRIAELPGVESVFVYPNMGDGGCATGAALLANGGALVRRRPLRDVYLGPAYDQREIESALRQEGLRFGHSTNVAEVVADLLAQHRIVARFDGRMEYGPRALGNRSILYPAHDPAVNLWLNQQLGRTEFMPFAPAALASEAGRLFRNVAGCRKTAEFMTMTFDCTDWMVTACPAAVHVDRTARPQLVSEHTSPGFDAILRRYYERTGVPAVINTSFNMHEEPIVCSPADAVRAFLLGNIDYLVAGPFVVPHPRLDAIDESRGNAAVPLARAVGGRRG